MDTLILDRPQRLWRSVLGGGGLLILVFLFFWNPGQSFIQMKSPMIQEVLGIPCPFCGMTRSSHWILNGEWRTAAYYNLMTFPAIIAGTTVSMMWIWEAARGRAHAGFQKLPGILTRYWPWVLALLIGFWVIHLTMALAFPKPELLNPSAPLFPDFLSRPQL
ncbi:MAG: DUF2752 domain-containing protein [Verrucomicrobiota bacterium]